MSRTVAVVTGAFTNDPNDWACLRHSAAKCGLRLHVLGEGHGYPHLGVFPQYLIPYVQALPDDYVLLTDAYDVIVNRWDADEVIRLVDATKSGLLVSCNDECWPEGSWCEAYPDTGTPWRTACAGQYVGNKEAVLNLWHEFGSGRWEQTAGGTTQEMMHRMYAADPWAFDLDRRCEVFQIMGAASKDHVGVQAEEAINWLTKTKPMFLHFGGRAAGLREWYEFLWGLGRYD